MKLKIAVFMALPLLISTSDAHALSKDASQVKAVVTKSIDSILHILRNKNLKTPEKKAKVRAVVEPVFDLKLMGKLTLGKKHWGKLGKPQKDEFSELFVKTIQDSFFDKMELFSDETVEYQDPVPTRKGKFKMPTLIISKGQPYELIYKLYRKKKTWRIYDVEIEGISLVRAYGSQYDQFLRKSSIEKLLVKMREKSLSKPKGLKKLDEEKKAKKRKRSKKKTAKK